MIELSTITAEVGEWQTLLTGFLAIAAAYWAARPVYQQIGLMRAQNNVMVRATIGEMVLQLDVHLNCLEAIISKPVNDIQSSLNYYNQNGPGIDCEWVSQTIQEFGRVETELKALFSLSRDVQALEDAKLELLAAIDTLDSCLRTVFLPEDADRFPEQYNWSDEQRSDAYAAATLAEGELQGRSAGVGVAAQRLKKAYINQKAVLVGRLRTIDDQLLV